MIHTGVTYSLLNINIIYHLPSATLVILAILTASPIFRRFKLPKRHADAAAKSLQSCPTLCDPTDSSPPGYAIPGFSRQEHWSGLPFPSPVHESEKWKWSRSVVSDSSDPMDCSPPGSSIHGIFQARVLEWVAIAFSETSMNELLFSLFYSIYLTLHAKNTFL